MVHSPALAIEWQDITSPEAAEQSASSLALLHGRLERLAATGDLSIRQAGLCKLLANELELAAGCFNGVRADPAAAALLAILWRTEGGKASAAAAWQAVRRAGGFQEWSAGEGAAAIASALAQMEQHWQTNRLWQQLLGQPGHDRALRHLEQLEQGSVAPQQMPKQQAAASVAGTANSVWNSRGHPPTPTPAAQPNTPLAAGSKAGREAVGNNIVGGGNELLRGNRGSRQKQTQQGPPSAMILQQQQQASKDSSSSSRRQRPVPRRRHRTKQQNAGGQPGFSHAAWCPQPVRGAFVGGEAQPATACATVAVRPGAVAAAVDAKAQVFSLLQRLREQGAVSAEQHHLAACLVDSFTQGFKQMGSRAGNVAGALMLVSEAAGGQGWRSSHAQAAAAVIAAGGNASAGGVGRHKAAAVEQWQVSYNWKVLLGQPPPLQGVARRGKKGAART